MSPRSQEFLDAGLRRLDLARGALDSDPAGAISAAYYAMLHAARAALSEQDVYAKTHRGIWHEFRQRFAVTGQMDPQLVEAAQAVQPEREQADYEAWAASEEQGRRVISLAEAFLAAVQAQM